ncbi:MAG: hypothetical protein HQL70_02710 [Magnetococcales bacterium]|nr:hypothetical protein [Magnetococcales bacterium]
MAIIRILDAAPGMVLAADAQDMSGRMLLGAGKEITAKHLKTFRTWGVTEIDVQDSAEGEKRAAVDTKADESVTKQAQEHFCQNDLGNPLIAELFNNCIVQMQKQPQKKSSVKPEADKKPARRQLPQSSRGQVSRYGRR